MPTLNKFLLVCLIFGLLGCQDAGQSTIQAPLAPLDQPTATTLTLPTIAPTIQAMPQITATTEVSPTFGTYRDPRGIFTMDVPSNWKTTALDQGVGFTTLAYNASVIMTISFSWSKDPIDANQQVQIVEDVKTRTFQGYLTKDIVLNSEREGNRYVLAGTATLNGVATNVEFSIEQTSGGTIYLQSWLVPSEIWHEFQTTYQQPMQARLKIDDTAAQKAAQ